MNFFDIAVIIIVCFCLIRGAFRGILSELASIVGVVAGFYGAYNYYKVFTPILEKYIASDALINILIFLLLFCVILVSVNLIAIVLEKALKVAFLGWIDKTFGAVFGALKGVLVTAVLFIVITTFIPKDNTLISNSLLAPHVARVSSAMSIFLSNNMPQGVMEKIESIGKLWKS